MKEHVLFSVYGKGEVAELSFIGNQGCFRRCSLAFNSKTEDVASQAPQSTKKREYKTTIDNRALL